MKLTPSPYTQLRSIPEFPLRAVFHRYNLELVEALSLLAPGSPSDFLPIKPPIIAKFIITLLIVGMPSGKDFLLSR
jgi:hypothetical protein